MDSYIGKNACSFSLQYKIRFELYYFQKRALELLENPSTPGLQIMLRNRITANKNEGGVSLYDIAATGTTTCQQNQLQYCDTVTLHVSVCNDTASQRSSGTKRAAGPQMFCLYDIVY